MFKKKKLLAIVAFVVLIVVAGGYEEVLKAAPIKPPPMKVNGTLVQLTTPFTINLAGGHYGLVTVALLMTTAPAPTLDSSGDNVINLPENAVVRAIITNDLTGIDPSQLIDRAPRQQLLQEILTDLKTETDEPVTRVMFTDLAVQ
jgi:flagellar basal body-associated protein FliL